MWIVHLWWKFQYFIGMPNGSGRPYLFWSGFGGDLTYFAIIIGGIGLYKHHNCAVKHCPRFSRKHWQVRGTPLRTCHHHATKYWHNLLREEYKRDYKEQHELFNEYEGT